MFSWPWWIFSIIAAVIWGLHFNLVVKVSNVLPRDIYTPFGLGGAGGWRLNFFQCHTHCLEACIK